MPELANVGQVALQILTPECRVRNIVCVGGEARGRWGSSNPHPPPPSPAALPPTHGRKEKTCKSTASGAAVCFRERFGSPPSQGMGRSLPGAWGVANRRRIRAGPVSCRSRIAMAR